MFARLRAAVAALFGRPAPVATTAKAKAKPAVKVAFATVGSSAFIVSGTTPTGNKCEARFTVFHEGTFRTVLAYNNTVLFAQDGTMAVPTAADTNDGYRPLMQGVRVRIAYTTGLRLVPNSTTGLLERRFVWIALRLTVCAPANARPATPAPVAQAVRASIAGDRARFLAAR